MAHVYVAGSMRNPRVLDVALRLRDRGHDVFVDWLSGGPQADEVWQETQQALGLNMRQAVGADYAQNILAFDERHLDRSDAVVVVGPAGKSAHMEAMRHVFKHGRVAYLYLPDGDPERWDIMTAWFTDIVYDFGELDTLLWENA